MKITYKIKFSDFGICHVIAENFSEAEDKFLKAKYGGDEVIIKSIVTVLETKEPLV